MTNVTIVVPVLITSCQVSEKSKIGPDMHHISTSEIAMQNAQGDPDA